LRVVRVGLLAARPSRARGLAGKHRDGGDRGAGLVGFGNPPLATTWRWGNRRRHPELEPDSPPPLGSHPPTDKEHDPASLKFQSAARRRSPQPIGLSMRRPSTGAIEMPTLACAT